MSSVVNPNKTLFLLLLITLSHILLLSHAAPVSRNHKISHQRISKNIRNKKQQLQQQLTSDKNGSSKIPSSPKTPSISSDTLNGITNAPQRITVISRIDPPNDLTLKQATKLADSIRKWSKKNDSIRIFFFYTAPIIPKHITKLFSPFGVTLIPIKKTKEKSRLPPPSRKMAVFNEPSAFRNTDTVVFLDVDIFVTSDLVNVVKPVPRGMVRAAPATDCRFAELRRAYAFFNRTLVRPDDKDNRKKEGWVGRCPDMYINSGVITMSAETAMKFGSIWTKKTYELAEAGFGFFSDQLSFPESLLSSNTKIEHLPRDMNWSPSRHSVHQPGFTPKIIHHHRNQAAMSMYGKDLATPKTYRNHQVRYFPDFVMAGCAKGGSHSMEMYLKEHPGICWNSKKEPNFFLRSKKDNINGYSEGRYRSEFSHCKDTQLWGDGSVQLYWDKTAPERIMKKSPHAKILFLLRNPVDLIYSAWKHSLRDKPDSHANPDTFEKMIRKEIPVMERCLSKADSHCGDYSIYFGPTYLWRGLYSYHIQHWRKWFPDSNLLFIDNDDLLNNTVDTVNKVVRFLGMQKKEFGGNVGKLYNAGKHKKRRGFQRILDLDVASNQNITRAPVSRSLRSDLIDFYRKHTDLEMFGDESKFSHWWLNDS